MRCTEPFNYVWSVTFSVFLCHVLTLRPVCEELNGQCRQPPPSLDTSHWGQHQSTASSLGQQSRLCTNTSTQALTQQTTVSKKDESSFRAALPLMASSRLCLEAHRKTCRPKHQLITQFLWTLLGRLCSLAAKWFSSLCLTHTCTLSVMRYQKACSCLVTASVVFLEVMKAIISGLTDTKMVGARSVGTYCSNSPPPVDHVSPLSTGQQIRSLGEKGAMQPLSAPLIWPSCKSQK